MSKNVYDVLEDYDEHAQDIAEGQKKKLTKKEQRQQDKLLREHYGDVVPKEQHKPAESNEKPAPKDDYAPGEKRPYDRHSGTGRQAFGNVQKKGGHGKGNIGKVDPKDYEGVITKEDDIEIESEDEVDENQTNPENPNKKSKIKKKKKKSKLKYDDKTFPPLS